MTVPIVPTDAAKPARADRHASLAGRQSGIDLVRAFGVLAVVCYHYSYRFPSAFLFGGTHVEAFRLGHLGVNLFFIVSAFCISGSLERSGTLARFVAKRVARLLPAYLLCAVLTYLVVRGIGLPGRGVSLPVAILNLLWVNMVVPIPHIDGVYWTIVYELRFYLLLGPLYFLLRRDFARVQTAWRVLVVMAVAVHLAGLGLLASGDRPAASALEILARNLLLYPYTGYFLIGLTLFRWESCSVRQRVLDIALFAVAILATSDAMAEKIACLCFLPLCFVLLRARGLAIPRPILLIGFVSYPLYLLHQNIGLVIMRQSASVNAPFVPRALLAFAVVLGLAALVTYRIEPRIRPRIERRLAAWLERGFSVLARFAPMQSR